jgi:hypothetical protein
VALWLPPFYAEEPNIWFVSAEAQFTLAGITEKRTKFYYVLSQLDHHYVREVWDIVHFSASAGSVIQFGQRSNRGSSVKECKYNVIELYFKVNKVYSVKSRII